ncbi:unnamed protein product [Paramecium sonneborni]|uniref:Uncharacterized protein n=1 Tax=Paramecium sonneborni TaxID=65129 RepID=A0A8S1Q8U1_9CILI|nr:unnamed protein product [Paramecium sonneborni]
MSNQFENQNICQEIQTFKEKPQNYVVDAWNYYKDMKIKIQIQITITKDDYIIYSSNGAILRAEKFNDASNNPIIFKNMEQIRHLSWESDNRFNEKKNGKSIAFWNGNTLINVGGYYKKGLRQGQWKELMKHYGSEAKVFEFGEYYNDRRIRKWIYIYNNKKIDGGSYNTQGLKQGKWNELSDNFQNQAQVTYIGEYDLKGMKIGKWDIMYQQKQMQILQIIKQYVSGGGQYDYIKAQKIGKWIELCEEFEHSNQVTYIGEYDKKAMKVGRWDIWFQEICGKKEYKSIGGGLYDNLGGEKKIGSWIELWKGFQNDSQVTYKGEYNEQGMKVGRWEIWFQQICGKKDYKQIGGGLYDNLEGDKKFGTWIEQWNGFSKDSQLTYKGEYDNKSQKVGRWDILYQGEYDLEFQQIGGGLYKEGQVKIEMWIELWDGFWNEAQVTYNGQYDSKGMKIGRWDIMYCKKGEHQYQQIGGGLYDYEKGQKIGKWIEIFEGFYYRKKVINIGEYDQKGMKVGRWDIWFQEIFEKKEFKQIGGGLYQKGQKVGKWEELDDRFEEQNQVIYKGEYNQKGIKINRWDIFFKREYDKEYKQIGGGFYEEGLKIGDWEELCDKFYLKKYFILIGAYDQKGIKVGLWVERKYDQKKQDLY